MADSEKEVLREAAAYMDQMEMRRGSDGTVIERVGRPVLTFGDKARDNSNGTLWAWGKTGRPRAFLELYRGTIGDASWANAITLTSPELVSLKTPTRMSWQPERSQFSPTKMADAPLPEPREPARLRQMKELARQFTAHEFWDPNNSRFELRLLVQPVLRYNDEGAKLHDGTAFVLAHGTNPEIVLLIEAIGESLEAARWHYSAMRLGSAELHLELNGKEVWRQDRTPGVVGKPADPYWLFMVAP